METVKEESEAPAELKLPDGRVVQLPVIRVSGVLWWDRDEESCTVASCARRALFARAALRALLAGLNCVPPPTHTSS